MALTPKERAQRWRDRQKELRVDADRQKRQEETQAIYKRPFFEYVSENGNWSSFELPLELAGFVAPSFDDDRGPMAFANEDAIAGVDDPFTGADRSIGRAEVMIGCLIDAASELAGIVNRYKILEIEKRLSENEGVVLSGAAESKSALADMVRLSKMLDRLGKEARRTFPQWEARIE
jgi:hypothetical protein